ncbi:hypothetical protein [Modestobacter sp. SSW1-42]|uniref:hypothetical protein n=1 Tax=Modestobacter sp. SSW1-42 TaxID=596372 RepID=UPI003987E721
MLELGRSGSHGVPKGTVPVVEDGAVVATLRASNWKEAATADVAGREWVLRRNGSRELVGRWAVDPADAVRVRARQDSFWSNAWTLDLEGVPVQAQTVSRWTGGHRFTSGGQLLAQSGTTGRWSWTPTLTPQPQLGLDHAVFLLWMGFVLRNRAAAAAAA